MSLTTLDGKELLLYKNGNLIAGATTHSISKSTDTRETTTKDSGINRNRKPTLNDFEISAEGLLAYDATNGYKELNEARRNQERIEVSSEHEMDDGSVEIEEGFGYITSLELSAPMNDNATWSITITGDGDLEPSTASA